jgi:hypothetical protein
MSDSEELPDDFTTRIIVQLSVYLSVKDNKGKVKELKTTKIKELDYTLTSENYVEFLATVLNKTSTRSQRGDLMLSSTYILL